MAEPGSAMGVPSIAALFNNAVADFDNIQLGCKFSNDFTYHMVRLKVVQSRLARWGGTIDVNHDVRFSNLPATDPFVQDAHLLLVQIESTLRLARRTALRCVPSACHNTAELAVFGDQDIQPTHRTMYAKLKESSCRHHSVTGVSTTTKWAVYDAKKLDDLLGRIAIPVADLENLNLATSAETRSLVDGLVCQIDNKASLDMLARAARDLDRDLAESAGKKANVIRTRNTADEVHVEDGASAHIGNRYTREAMDTMSFTDETVNEVKRVVAKGQASVHIGNVYGWSA